MQISLSIVGAFSILLFVISLHLFFAKRGNALLNRLFSIVIFARAGQLGTFLLVASGQLKIFPVLLSIFIPLYFAAPACLFLYVNRFINHEKSFRKSDLLHFIPFLLAVIHVLPWWFSPSLRWEQIAGQILAHQQLYITEKTGLFPAYFYYAGRPLLWIGYLSAAWATLFTAAGAKGKKWGIPNTWIFFCLSTSTFFNLTSLAPLLFRIFPHPLFLHSWFIGLNCIVVTVIMFYIFHRPQFLYGHLIIGARWKDEHPIGIVLPDKILKVEEMNMTGDIAVTLSAPVFTPAPMGSPSPLLVPATLDTPVPSVTPAPIVSRKTKDFVEPVALSPKNNLLSGQMIIYTEAMKTFMDAEKPFLASGFQIIHLAQKLDIPVHHCSFIINNVIGKNFRDWINAFRIHHFIDHYPLLSDKMTIEAIASQSGFKSVATFYNAFKKETGSMPKAFFNKTQEEYTI